MIPVPPKCFNLKLEALRSPRTPATIYLSTRRNFQKNWIFDKHHFVINCTIRSTSVWTTVNYLQLPVLFPLFHFPGSQFCSSVTNVVRVGPESLTSKYMSFGKSHGYCKTCDGRSVLRRCPHRDVEPVRGGRFLWWQLSYWHMRCVIMSDLA
jgi:hypothetical protein